MILIKYMDCPDEEWVKKSAFYFLMGFLYIGGQVPKTAKGVD